MFKYCIIAFVMVLSLPGVAQQRGYLLLHQGDTIQGKRYVGIFDKGNHVRFRTDTGDLKIPTEEVKEIYWKNRKYRVIKDPFENRVEKFEVLVEGEVSLLYNSTNAKVIYARDRVQMNGKLYLIDKHHFSDKIWDMLSKCPVFEEKYSAYYNEHKDKKLFRRNRKAVEKWTEMIRYYNAHCGKETTAI